MAWRSHEGELLAFVEYFGKHTLHGLSEYPLLDAVADAEGRGNAHSELCQVVIEESRSRLHGVGHVDPVSAPGQDLPFQHSFAPGVLGNVERMTVSDLVGVNGLGKGGDGIVGSKKIANGGRKEWRAGLESEHPGLKP